MDNLLAQNRQINQEVPQIQIEESKESIRYEDPRLNALEQFDNHMINFGSALT